MTEALQKKVDFAIKLLRSIPTDDGPVEVSFSGGKDSEVILELAKMAGIPYRAIYKNTSIDPPGTIAHCKSKGVEIIRPKKTFLQIVQENGTPTRFSRFCCKYLKEYKILDRAVQGVRRCESTNGQRCIKSQKYAAHIQRQRRLRCICRYWSGRTMMCGISFPSMASNAIHSIMTSKGTSTLSVDWGV